MGFLFYLGMVGIYKKGFGFRGAGQVSLSGMSMKKLLFVSLLHILIMPEICDESMDIP